MTAQADTAEKPSPRRPPLAILIAISALQPFALNVLAPATPSLARALATDYGTVQLTLTLYLLVVAVTQVIVGPISDRIGRRPCVLAGAVLFLAGSALGAAAGSIEVLLLARAVQAMGGGTCFALSRAVVRDTARRDEAASLIGYMTMVMVVSPMLAPLAGGFLDAHFGWRSIFLAMIALGAPIALAAYALLGETAPRGLEGSVLGAVRAYPALMRDATFVGYAAAMSFTTAGFFAFIAGAPYIVVEAMGRSPDVYGVYFILNAGGYMVGNFLSGRYGQVLGSERLVFGGVLVCVTAVTVALGFALLGPWNPVTLFVPLAVNAIGNGLVIPGATASALSVRPDLAGTASGLAGATQLGLGAAAAALAGWLVPLWPPALVVIMMACAMLGLIAFLAGRARQAI